MDEKPQTGLAEKAPLVEKIDKAAENPLPAPLNEILPAQTSGATFPSEYNTPPFAGDQKKKHARPAHLRHLQP